MHASQRKARAIPASAFLEQGFLADPYPTYARLRAEGRIHWTELYGGAWMVTRYDDIVAGLHDPRFECGKLKMLVRQFSGEERASLADFERTFGMWLLASDAPVHTALSRFVGAGFAPARLAPLREHMRAAVESLLERNAAPSSPSATGAMDFMADFAEIYPAMVLSEMLGIDPADQQDFMTWTDDITGFFGSPAKRYDLALRAQQSVVEMSRYFAAALERRRSAPGQDLLSLMLERQAEAGFSDEQMLAQCSMLLSAGIETTSNFLCLGLLALLRNQEQLAALRAEPRLLHGALAELLRYDSPLQFTTRVASQDMTLLGESVETGQLVIFLLGSANRDPDKFERPDELDVARKRVAHLSFSTGAHTCTGASLASQEVAVAFEMLLERFGDIELAGEPEFGLNPRFRGIKRLPIAFRARG